MNNNMNKKQQMRRFIIKNVIYVILVVLLGVAVLIVKHKNDDLTKSVKKQDESISKLTNDVDTLRKKNSRTIYLPENDVSNLTEDQKKSIVLLTDIFSRITTFSNSTMYESNYKYATEYIKDPAFYTDFLAKPKDDSGNSVVEMSGIKMDNVRTVVVPIGKDTYRVFVSFVAYHAHSDLYQRNQLKVTNKIIDVSGSFESFDKTSIQVNMGKNTSVTRVSDIN